MSYRKLTIADVNEIIGRWRGAQSARQIARETGLDRKTVRRYLAAATSCAVARDKEPSSQDIERIAQRVQTRPRPERSETWKQLLPHKERIAAAIHGQKPLRLRGVHRRLQHEGVIVTYWMLRRFALQMQNERPNGESVEPVLQSPETLQAPTGPIANALIREEATGTA